MKANIVSIYNDIYGKTEKYGISYNHKFQILSEETLLNVLKKDREALNNGEWQYDKVVITNGAESNYPVCNNGAWDNYDRFTIVEKMINSKLADSLETTLYAISDNEGRLTIANGVRVVMLILYGNITNAKAVKGENGYFISSIKGSHENVNYDNDQYAGLLVKAQYSVITELKGIEERANQYKAEQEAKAKQEEINRANKMKEMQDYYNTKEIVNMHEDESNVFITKLEEMLKDNNKAYKITDVAVSRDLCSNQKVRAITFKPIKSKFTESYYELGNKIAMMAYYVQAERQLGDKYSAVCGYSIKLLAGEAYGQTRQLINEESSIDSYYNKSEFEAASRIKLAKRESILAEFKRFISEEEVARVLNNAEQIQKEQDEKRRLQQEAKAEKMRLEQEEKDKAKAKLLNDADGLEIDFEGCSRVVDKVIAKLNKLDIEASKVQVNLSKFNTESRKFAETLKIDAIKVGLIQDTEKMELTLNTIIALDRKDKLTDIKVIGIQSAKTLNEEDNQYMEKSLLSKLDRIEIMDCDDSDLADVVNEVTRSKENELVNSMVATMIDDEKYKIIKKEVKKESQAKKATKNVKGVVDRFKR